MLYQNFYGKEAGNFTGAFIFIKQILDTLMYLSG